MSSEYPTLGALLRGVRKRNGWTVKEMSVRSGIPESTLSKVEHDRLTLTYDKLVQLSQRLGLQMSDLFAVNGEGQETAANSRRSLGTMDRSVRVETANYDYHYLCTEIRKKRMIPVFVKVRAHSIDEFGDYVRHAGEEFIFVVKGAVEVHTEFYDPVLLSEGEALYIDAAMGHAYLAAEGLDEALILGVMASGEDDQMTTLLDLHNEMKDTGSRTKRKRTTR